ncbi:MAG: hypothetical protein ACRDYF_01190 [Acidimicrobiia bacterium]
MNDPVAVDGPLADRARTLRPVPLPVQASDSDAARLADELAAALRAVRGYVPHHIWWGAGPAHALLAYQALHAT